MRWLVLIFCFAFTACGPTEAEKERIAQVTCAIVAETRNMDAAQRVERINESRDALGLGPYLEGDDQIVQAVYFGVCELLVLDRGWEAELTTRREAEARRMAEREAELVRLAAEREAELVRLAAEREAERKKLAAEREAERKKLAAEREAERKKLAAERLTALRVTVAERGYAVEEDTIRLKGLTYLRGDDSPFSGVIQAYSGDGKLEIREHYEDGKRHGLKEQYDDNGKLEMRQTYEHDEKQGLKESFYDNGTVRWRGYYEKGSLVWMETFNENGNLRYSSRRRSD